MSDKEVCVYVDLQGDQHLVGRLWAHRRRGRESALFEYDAGWLAHSERFALEPALNLTEGTFHTGADKAVFGALGDSAPDRWGRLLMRRAEARRARRDVEQTRTLREIDYLLGVNDAARQGALRFSQKPGGPFLTKSDKHPIPPLVVLPNLLSATEKLLDDKEDDDDIRLLLAPGSSLGGARPKASVLDNDGSLSIAKFRIRTMNFRPLHGKASLLHLPEMPGLKQRIGALSQSPENRSLSCGALIVRGTIEFRFCRP